MEGTNYMVQREGSIATAGERTALLNDNQGGERGGVENNELAILDIEAPALGMVFNTIDELFEFYKKYARVSGFGIAKRGRRKDDLTGLERWQTIICTKGREHKACGSNILSQRPSQRCGCKARVCCSKKEGFWVITKVELGHNHELKPSESRFIAQHRIIEDHIRRQVETNDMAGIRPTLNVKSIVFHEGGHEQMSCLNVDLKNHVKKFRRLNLVGGDAQTMIEMFGKMQNESKDFFYFMKPDKDGRLKHVFWADGRCRAAYEEFSDVITFDTTYLINKYEMPCAVFVGVNHHGQSILLGCALLNNEKSKTFIWLFETWLRCMGGKHPEAIITDQCTAIRIAVATVFPNARHRLCLWHIVRKFPTKFSNKRNHVAIKEAFMDAIYNSVSESNFEERWQRMVDEFQLQENDWIGQLYESRHYWVPIYVTSSFWAGMSTTQRSESMNSFFDGYINSRSSLIQFVEQYALAVKDKIENEVQLDFLSRNAHIPCVTRWIFESQLCKAYTSSIFKMVQKQIVDSMYCDLRQISQDGSKITYEVTELVIVAGVKRKRVKFLVNFYTDQSDVSCNCLTFEFRGILCSHIFKVMIANDVDVIPDKYILRRWRKDVGRSYSNIKVGSGTPSIEMIRAKSLEKTVFAAIDIAVSDVEKFDYLDKGLKEHLNHLRKWSVQSALLQVGNNEGEDLERVRGRKCHQLDQSPRIKDPKVIKRRGRPKSKRHLSEMEKAKGRKVVSRSQSRLAHNTVQREEQYGSATPHIESLRNDVQQVNLGPTTTLIEEAIEEPLVPNNPSAMMFGLGGYPSQPFQVIHSNMQVVPTTPTTSAPIFFLVPSPPSRMQRTSMTPANTPHTSYYGPLQNMYVTQDNHLQHVQER